MGTVVRSAFQNYLLTKQPFSYKEDPKHPFYKINYENRIVAMANRYALYNWRLLIIHLPNINPTGVEAKIFQTLINELANRGTSVLVVVAASSEILTRADNLFEFDQEDARPHSGVFPDEPDFELRQDLRQYRLLPQSAKSHRRRDRAFWRPRSQRRCAAQGLRCVL